MPRHPRLDTCWTCRLRRKKCDGASPACKNCVELGIDCHAGTRRPEWMDGGSRQKEMARRLSDQVKRGAVGRRERRWGPGAARDATFSRVITPRSYMMQPHARFLVENEDAVETESMAAAASSPAAPPPEHEPGALSPTQSLGLSLRPPVNHVVAVSAGDMTVVGEPLQEEHHIMVYLDHCFPFLFPFYRPTLLGTSRGWLLHLLQTSATTHASATSLGSYLFAVVAHETLSARNDESLATRARDRVMQTVEKGYETIHRNVVAMSGSGPSVSKRAAIMGELVQLLVSHLFVGRSEAGGWERYLPIARTGTTLLDDMLAEHLDKEPLRRDEARSAPPLGLQPVLDQLSQREAVHAYPQAPVWSHEQAAFRFYTSVLLYADIVAATALGRRPLLGRWHARLLRGAAERVDASSPYLDQDLSQVTGCEVWTISAISEIAALVAWKDEATRSQGSLSMQALVQRAGTISKRLSHGLGSLEARKREASRSETSRLRRLRPFGSAVSGFSDGDIQAHIPTYMWTYAARIYLAVVVSGWQPLQPEISRNVRGVLNLLELLLQDTGITNGAAQLRALAWPVCVAGCLAESDAVACEFRNVISEIMGEMVEFGSMCQALKTMEAVWKDRDSIEKQREVWDIRVCLGSLGSPVLLI